MRVEYVAAGNATWLNGSKLIYKIQFHSNSVGGKPPISEITLGCGQFKSGIFDNKTRGECMTREECRNLTPGTMLLVGNKILEGADPNIECYLGGIITFKKFIKDKWIYFEEGEDSPFRYDEVVGIATFESIDDESIPYQSGDISLIFGEVS